MSTSRCIGFGAALVTGVLVLGCGPYEPNVPGMKTISPAPEEDTPPSTLRVPLPKGDMRGVVVAYPLDACAFSTDSAVFVDGDGRFLGAVAPGTATMLRVPRRFRVIHEFAVSDLHRARGSWLRRQDIPLHKNPAALLVRSSRTSAMECDLYVRPIVAVVSHEALKSVLGELAWIDRDGERGAEFLDEHRASLRRMISREGR